MTKQPKAPKAVPTIKLRRKWQVTALIKDLKLALRRSSRSGGEYTVFVTNVQRDPHKVEGVIRIQVC